MTFLITNNLDNQHCTSWSVYQRGWWIAVPLHGVQQLKEFSSAYYVIFILCEVVLKMYKNDGMVIDIWPVCHIM